MILIAEDFPPIANLIAFALKSMGHQFQVAQRGDTALELAGRTDFDLLILDENMPGMHGTEVLQQIRSASGPNQNTPAILCSANLFAAKGSLDVEELFDAVIHKPFSPREMVEEVEALLQTARQPAEATS